MKKRSRNNWSKIIFNWWKNRGRNEGEISIRRWRKDLESEVTWLEEMFEKQMNEKIIKIWVKKCEKKKWRVNIQKDMKKRSIKKWRKKYPLRYGEKIDK